jgi:hypothetical protein
MEGKQAEKKKNPFICFSKDSPNKIKVLRSLVRTFNGRKLEIKKLIPF